MLYWYLKYCLKSVFFSCNRFRQRSLSEGDELSSSEDSDDDNERTGMLKQSGGTHIPSSFSRSHHVRTEETSQKEHTQNAAVLREEKLLSKSDDKDFQYEESDEEEDVFDSDWSGDLPDLTDPSWESPAKEKRKKKSSSKSPKKKSLEKKEKKKRSEESWKKGESKLMKSARKAFEAKQKMFQGSKKDKGGSHRIVSSKSTEVPNKNNNVVSELRQDGSLPGNVQNRLLSSQPPKGGGTGGVPSGVSSSSEEAKMTGSDSSQIELMQRVKARMQKSLEQGGKENRMDIKTESESVSQIRPQLIDALGLSLTETGSLLTQNKTQASTGDVTNSVSMSQNLSASLNVHDGDPAATNAEDLDNSFDSGETVIFKESVTPSSDSELLTNSNIERSVDDGNAVEQTQASEMSALCPLTRKRHGSDNLEDKKSRDPNKKQKRSHPEEHPKKKNTISQPSVVSSSSSGLGIITNVYSEVAASTNEGSSAEIYDNFMDISLPLEGSALQLANITFNSEGDAQTGKVSAGQSSNRESAISGDSTRSLNPVENISDSKNSRALNEIIKRYDKLKTKKTVCEVNIKHIKEKCDREIAIQEEEKKHIEKEMNELLSIIKNWTGSSTDVVAVLSKGSNADGMGQETTSVEAQQHYSSSKAQHSTSGYSLQGALQVQQPFSKTSASTAVPPASALASGPGIGVNSSAGMRILNKEQAKDPSASQRLSIISDANINNFGNENIRRLKKTARKSQTRNRQTPSAKPAVQSATVSSVPSGVQLGESAGQNFSSTPLVPVTVSASNMLLSPTDPRHGQNQLNTTVLWPANALPTFLIASDVQKAPNVVVRPHMSEPQPHNHPPPSYAEHMHNTVRIRTQVGGTQQFVLVSQEQTPDRQPISTGSVGSSVQQAPSQYHAFSLQQQQQLQQQHPVQQQQQQLRQITIPAQASTSSMPSQIVQQPHHIQGLQQPPTTARQSSIISVSNSSQAKSRSPHEGSVATGSNSGPSTSKMTHIQQDVHTLVSTSASSSAGTTKSGGHHSHLLVSAQPAPTVGSAVALAAQHTQPSSVVKHNRHSSSSQGTRMGRSFTDLIADSPAPPQSAAMSPLFAAQESAVSPVLQSPPAQPQTSEVSAADFTSENNSSIASIRNTSDLVILSQVK